jgi:flagellar hook assembly protein FlgD
MTIRVALPETGRISVRIFDVAGEPVRNICTEEERPAGASFFKWEGENGSGQKVASGLYLVVVNVNDFKKILKIVVLR